MPRQHRQPVDPVPLIWLSFCIVAAVLGIAGPAWSVVLCVPSAGLICWAISAQQSRRRRERLARVAEMAIGLGLLGRAAEETPPEADDRPDDPIERLGAIVAARRAMVDNDMVRRIEELATVRANLDAVDAPVLATDESGRVSITNRAAERLLANRARRVLGVPIDEVLTNSALLELHARAERGEACKRQVRLTLDGTVRVYEVSAIPVRLDIGQIPARVPQRCGVVLTIKDVHELAQTLQLRTDFAANASHELRTPIATIRTAIETMRGAAEDDPAMHERLFVMIENNVARLEEMVGDLLDLSRLESEGQPLRIETFDLGEMSDALGAMFEPACRKRGLSLVFDISGSLKTLRTDRKLLLLVLRNLIDNATKFAFENTTITVTCEPSAGEAGGRGVRLAVADRGVGIPLKHQQRIFERFYQVDESRARVGTRRGSGLGLAIVRHAVRRLDGEITVESVWQNGTTMIVSIPDCVPPDAGDR
ncbi:MAG: PAS domain-containing protein [Phycisphaeraceae bacterium]|nr:MAG: PAS domain-containing protein [Phycisphaeraceae bacterium]